MYFFENSWREFEVISIDDNKIEISEVVDGQVEHQVIETDIYSENLAQIGTI
jgi:hypothetical protein